MCLTSVALLNLSETLHSWKRRPCLLGGIKVRMMSCMWDVWSTESGTPSTAELVALTVVTFAINLIGISIPCGLRAPVGVYLLRFSSGPRGTVQDATRVQIS